ncbi:MAG TPA: T9SS type A sorting domain-containing protein [Chitinophagales bacterium]|nr:T9SS type A sorting domain-containing protein [Chitinophagales bacterium]
MTRLFLLFIVTCCCLSIDAQTVVSDSAQTGEEARLTTFYSLATGQKTVTRNDDWHLAISIRPTQFPENPIGGTTIRMNEPIGVNVYYVPNAAAAQFNTVDASAFKHWTKLHDSDVNINDGALNSNRDLTNIYDFGWGTYNAATHHVVGDSLYLIELPDQQVKKFQVVILNRDTAFDIKYANLDNSDLHTIHITKKDYLGKKFVYLNLSTNAVMDKEPLTSEWDLQFLRYDATDAIIGKHVPVVGVWLNTGAQAARRENHPQNDNYFGNLTFSANLNAIGWNWKQLTNSLSLESGKNELESFDFYTCDDSLTYFVKTVSGDYYKLVLTGYDNRSGKVRFYTEKLALTGIDEPTGDEIVNNLHIYPNPAQSVLNVLVPTVPSTLRVMDISGRVISEYSATDNLVQYNTADLTNGVYLMQVNAAGKTSTSKFIVSK